MRDPYRQAVAAYANPGRQSTDQRALEADALLKAARRLEDVLRTWPSAGEAALEEALLYNRKLWMIFAAEAADGAGRLPDEVRNNIASIALFVFKRSLELLAAPAADKVEALIEINRSLAAGLLTRPTPDAPPPPAASLDAGLAAGG